VTNPHGPGKSDGYEFSFHMQADADDQAATTVVTVSDDDLREVGWLVDTKDLDKRGWEDRYLAALSITGKLVDSADAAGVSVRRVQQRIQSDAIFAELHQQALARLHARIFDAGVERALKGVPTTYTRKDGTVVETYTHDNRLLEFVMSKLLPDITDRKHAADALANGITINFQIGERPPGPIPAAEETLELPAGDIEEEPA